MTDPEGRYDASHGGDVEGLHWVLDGTEPIALNQLKADYYEPGLLAKIWTKQPLRRVKPLNEIDIKLPPEASVALQNGKVVVTLTDRGGGIGPTDVSLDGALFHREPTPKVAAKALRFTVDLAPLKGRLVPGQENRIRVVGHTFDRKARPDRPDYLAGRAVEATVPLPKAAVAEPPRVFILACGASDYAGTKLDLRYAAKDAMDLSRELTRAAVSMVGPERVSSTLLASDAEHPEVRPATRKNLLAALAEIRAKAKATDVVVLYLSGHGVAAGSGDRDYYYVCADADDATPGTALFPTVTLSGRAIADALAGMNAAKKVVILDTCASGEFGKREGGTDIRRAWEDMKDRSGTYVLAGCAADAVSYESSRYNQGLLTYALIEAMKANDGVWADGLLDVQKWLGAAEAGVPKLVEESQIEGVQRPEFKSGKDARDFYVGRLSGDERKTIALASPLPILLPAGNVRDEDDPSDEDTLGLRAKIDALLLSRSSRGRGQGYALWRTAAQPGAYRFNVRYRKGGTAKVSLLRFPKDPKAAPEPVATFTVTAPAERLPEAVLGEVLKRLAS